MVRGEAAAVRAARARPTSGGRTSPGSARWSSATSSRSSRGRSTTPSLVVAHRDNRAGSSGANDNASGTAALVELARGYATVGTGGGAAPATAPHASSSSRPTPAPSAAMGAARFAASARGRQTTAALVLDGLAGRVRPRRRVRRARPSLTALRTGADPARAARRRGCLTCQADGCSSSSSRWASPSGSASRHRCSASGVPAVRVGTAPETEPPAGTDEVELLDGVRLTRLGRAVDATLGSLDERRRALERHLRGGDPTSRAPSAAGRSQLHPRDPAPSVRRGGARPARTLPPEGELPLDRSVAGLPATARLLAPRARRDRGSRRDGGSPARHAAASAPGPAPRRRVAGRRHRRSGAARRDRVAARADAARPPWRDERRRTISRARRSPSSRCWASPSWSALVEPVHAPLRAPLALRVARAAPGAVATARGSQTSSTGWGCSAPCSRSSSSRASSTSGSARPLYAASLATIRHRPVARDASLWPAGSPSPPRSALS